jgi:hypothetical protein
VVRSEAITFIATTYYHAPDTSDKLDDECWPEYWDRKRRERHGENCNCVLCANEDIIGADHSWCPHTYKDDPEVIT